jgi:hypothetical protein
MSMRQYAAILLFTVMTSLVASLATSIQIRRDFIENCIPIISENNTTKLSPEQACKAMFDKLARGQP